MKKVLILALTLGAASAFAAFDNAADAAYNSGWVNGSNGGVGLGAWSLSPASNGGTAGFFIYTSLANGGGNSGPGVDTSNKAWGLYANNGGLATAVRAFPLITSGGSFTLGMDNGWINTGSKVGFTLGGPDGTFTFGFKGGDSAYYVKDNATTSFTSIPFTDGGVNTTLTVTGSGFTFTATSLTGGGSFTYSGVNTGGFNTVTLFNDNAGSGGNYDAYFNNLSQTVPEPSAILALAMGATVLIRRRKA